MSADSTLSFVFTEESFRVDKPDEDAGAFNGLRDDFIKNRYRALFKLGFKAHERNESPSLRFLHTLAETYVADLTAQPDLEVAREWTKVELSDESYDKLMRAVPFGIGTEYINRAWLALVYMHISSVFSEDLKNYNGTVRTFLAEKSQNLRIPERIFFHLVETTKDVRWPFAFMATYSTKDSDGNVRHMPLSHALEEYKSDRDKLLELLACLSKVAEISPVMSRCIESGELFHPLYFDASDAYEFYRFHFTPPRSRP